MAITVRELVTKWGFDVDDRPMRRMEGNIRSLKRLATGVGIAITGISIATTLLLKQAGQFEQWQIAFNTMLGSSERATKLLNEIKQFTLETPFQLPQVIEGAKRLLAFGIEAEKIIPTLKILGDVSAGLGVPIGRMILNFGQVRTQAKLTGRELRDFAVLGVPLIDALAEILNVATNEVQDLVSAGQVGFDVVEKAFQQMAGTGGKFANLMKRQMQALFGILSNIKDMFIQIAIALGTDMLPQAKAVTKQFLDFIMVNKQLIQLKLGRLIKQLIGFSKDVLKVGIRTVKVLIQIVNIFGGLEKVLKGLALTIAAIFAFNVLSLLGNMLLIVSSLISSFTIFGNTALLAQAKAMLLPLALGVAFVGLILILEDVIAFFKGKDSIVKIFSDSVKEMSDQARILVGALNPLLAIFTLIKNTLELMKAVGLFEETIVQPQFRGIIPFKGAVQARGPLGIAGTVTISPTFTIPITVGPGADVAGVAGAAEAGVREGIGGLEDMIIDLMGQVEDRGK